MAESTTPDEPVYHITTPDLWSPVSGNGSYAAPSLESEGFIHCSTREQVERSMNRFFGGHDSVILLRIDPKLLRSELKYEPADGDSFPHIYGELNIDAVTGVEYVWRGDDGKFHIDGERE
jgi:uncharacterized protein (DUF952 family)